MHSPPTQDGHSLHESPYSGDCDSAEDTQLPDAEWTTGDDDRIDTGGSDSAEETMYSVEPAAADSADDIVESTLTGSGTVQNLEHISENSFSPTNESDAAIGYPSRSQSSTSSSSCDSGVGPSGASSRQRSRKQDAARTYPQLEQLDHRLRSTINTTCDATTSQSSRTNFL